MIFFAEGERGGVPVLPSVPGPEDKSFWGPIRDAVLGRRPVSGPVTGVRIPSPAAPPAPEPAAPIATTPSPPRGGGPYCFGADVAICESAPSLLKGSCYVATGVVCLTLGIFVFLVLIGIGVNALVRS